MEDVVLIQAKRTPFGNFGGTLRDVPAVELAGRVIKAVLDEMPVGTNEVDLLAMGISLPGSGLSPGRQAVFSGGLDKETCAYTIDRACCSSMTAIGLGFEKISAGRAGIAVCGGMENMSSTPYLVPQMRWGQRLGDFSVKDELVIRNPYLQAPMAQYAGEVAVEWGVDRQEQDEWGVRSNLYAVEADRHARFVDELIKVEVPGKKGNTLLFERDEHPRSDSSLEKLSKLNPIYGSPTVTAGNASAISDGAAAVLLMSRNEAKMRGVKPLVRIIDHVAFCGEPRNSAMLPGVAIKKILAQTGLSLDNVKLIEINEAFAVMPLVSSLYLADKDRKMAEEIRSRLNVNGGAIAIGHPLGASGARILMHLVYELRRRGERYGIAAICGAIGQVDAVVVETLG